MISETRLATILEALPKQRIALVGDLFLDRYLEIEPGVHELSVETGLEAYQVTRVRNSPGALGTVMNNLAALGVGKLIPVTVIGDDGQGDDLRRALKRLPVDPAHMISDPDRLTPTYTKPMRTRPDGSGEELNRLDFRDRRPIADATTRQLCDHLRQAFDESDGLIVLDQIVESNWGVVNESVRETLVDLHRHDPRKLIFVDSRAHLGRFACGVLKGNRSELVRAAGAPDASDQSVRRAAEQLARRTNQAVFCTVGEEGILVFRPQGEPTLVPGIRVSGPVDIVGAGDAASSGLVTALLAGATELEAAAMANLVASITVQQLGTTGTASPAQVRERHSQTAP